MIRAALAAAALLSSPAGAQGPATRTGLKAPIAAGYQPESKDERGLWLQVDEAERQIKASNFLNRDPALNGYIRGVLCRTVARRSARPFGCT